MKNISEMDQTCVFGGNSMEGQFCNPTEPYGFKQWGFALDDQISRAAERPWDPPLGQSVPGRFDIALGFLGVGVMFREIYVRMQKK